MIEQCRDCGYGWNQRDCDNPDGPCGCGAWHHHACHEPGQKDLVGHDCKQVNPKTGWQTALENAQERSVKSEADYKKSLQTILNITHYIQDPDWSRGALEDMARTFESTVSKLLKAYD